MLFDMRTTLIASLFVNIALAVVAIGVHVTYRRKIVCTLCWVYVFLANTLGQGLLAFRGILSDFITIVVANTFILVGLISAIIGVTRLVNHRFPNWIPAVLVSLFFGFLFMFGIVVPSLFIRALFISFVISSLSLFGAWFLFFPSDKEIANIFRPEAIAFLAVGLLYAVRFVFVALNGLFGDWMDAPSWEPVFIFFSISIYIGMGFGYLRMLDGLLASHLERSSEEKTLLLKEMRHRTKNNLTLISSLISLQAESMSDKKAKEAFIELESRLRTISAVYRLLSAVDGDRSASVNEYLSAVIAGIQDGLAANLSIEFVVNIEKIELDSTLLVPLGLIVNELATNAVKHAFSEESSGKVKIEFTEKDNRYHLHLSDNGIGMSASDREKGGLGLTLAESLAAQLGGELKMESQHNEGVQFDLLFSK